MLFDDQKISDAKVRSPINMLTKKTIDHLAQLERQSLDASRAPSRESRSTVQMSIRMDEEQYLHFRALCRLQRRTNGQMVEHLLKLLLADV